MGPSLFSLQDRVAVVTGAMGRLGVAFSQAVLDMGGLVAGIDVSNAFGSQSFHELLASSCGRFHLFPADICDREALRTAHAQILQQMGTPAVVVNNAGIDRPPGVSAKTMRLENISFAECQRIVEVNLLGLFQVCQEFLPSLVATQGAIVNVGSLYASISPDPRLYAHLPCDPPFIKPPMYGASKAAVVNLTRYLAVHLAPSGVRVNCLSPGGVRAEQDGTFVEGYASRVPMGRMAELEDLVGPFLFLASDASRYVTGQNLCVDGGFQCW